jgi:ABC-type glycerol-3-phosphate transport system substrate-binding protein
VCILPKPDWFLPISEDLAVKLPAFVVVPVLLAAGLVAAGCGGADDTSSGEGTGSGAGGSVSLVAYSTPQVVYDEIVPAFQKTEPGAGVKLPTS